MPHHCYLCEKEAHHHVKLKNGDVLDCCDEHYNRWICERLGLEYTRYVHPKTISVFGERFRVTMQVGPDGVMYYASRGRKGVEESYALQLPFSMSGKEAMKYLRGKVSLTTMFVSDDKDELDDAGTIGIEYDDTTEGEDPYFIFKGRKLSPDHLIELLSFYPGYNLSYQLEPRVPDPDAHWITYEGHVVPGEDDDDN